MEKNSAPIGGVSLAWVEQSREQMHQKIDDLYDELVQKILTEGKRLTMGDGEQLLSLAADPARFKGLKPSRLLFPDGRIATVQNWRQAILEILQECNKDPIRHDRMVRLRDLVAGRLRPLLSGSPKGMNVPVMIDEGLYLEGKLDTEYLIKTVRDQILNPAGYDYDKIGLVVYDPKQEMVQKSQSMQITPCTVSP
mgnify:FL=1